MKIYFCTYNVDFLYFFMIGNICRNQNDKDSFFLLFDIIWALMLGLLVVGFGVRIKRLLYIRLGEWKNKVNDGVSGVVQGPLLESAESENLIKWGTFHTKNWRTPRISEAMSVSFKIPIMTSCQP